MGRENRWGNADSADYITKMYVSHKPILNVIKLMYVHRWGSIILHNSHASNSSSAPSIHPSSTLHPACASSSRSFLSNRCPSPNQKSILLPTQAKYTRP